MAGLPSCGGMSGRRAPHGPEIACVGSMRVLVVFGSRNGGTEGLAREVGNGLMDAGHEVEVRSGRGVNDLSGWDAVVVGGALYAWIWQKDARRFVKRMEDELRLMPVWFFSSGPLDDSAGKGDIAPTWPVERWMARVGARGHVTFGGRLTPEASGPPALPRGDWRDMDAARAWGRKTGETLATLALEPRPRLSPARHGVRRWLIALSLFTGITAVLGGIELVAWPTGAPWLAFTVDILARTPFTTFLVPGLLLMLLVGLGNMVSSTLALLRHRSSDVVSFGAGATLLGWLVGEMALLRTFHWLHVVYLAVALATMAAALWLRSQRRRAVRRA